MENALTQPSPKHLEMMKQGVGIPVQLTAPSGKQSAGEVRFQEWDRQQRMRRALRMLGIMWGLMIVSVFIPLAHFVLVPGLLIAGPIAAFIVYGQERAILGGQSQCPECGAFLPIVGGPDKWPKSDLCSRCQTQVTIEKRT